MGPKYHTKGFGSISLFLQRGLDSNSNNKAPLYHCLDVFFFQIQSGGKTGDQGKTLKRGSLQRNTFGGSNP